jgi:sec-independent protein translocase protein TatA
MFGLQEWLIPLGILILILIFGGRRLGQVGTGLGEGIRNFRKALKGDEPNQGGGSDTPPGPPKP